MKSDETLTEANERLRCENNALRAEITQLTLKINALRIQQMDRKVEDYWDNKGDESRARANQEAERCAFWVGVFNLEKLSTLPGARIEGNSIIVPSKMNNQHG